MSLSTARCAAAVLTAVLVSVPASGCLSPDRWPPFERRLERPPVSDTLPTVTIPGELKPEQAETPGFEWPADGEAVNLSLEQATMLALRNNKDLRVEQLAPVIAGTFEEIERGAYDPELVGDLAY